MNEAAAFLSVLLFLLLLLPSRRGGSVRNRFKPGPRPAPPPAPPMKRFP